MKGFGAVLGGQAAALVTLRVRQLFEQSERASCTGISASVQCEKTSGRAGVMCSHTRLNCMTAACRGREGTTWLQHAGEGEVETWCIHTALLTSHWPPVSSRVDWIESFPSSPSCPKAKKLDKLGSLYGHEGMNSLYASDPLGIPASLMHKFFSPQNYSKGHAERVSLWGRLSKYQPHMMVDCFARLSHEHNKETVGFWLVSGTE